MRYLLVFLAGFVAEATFPGSSPAVRDRFSRTSGAIRRRLRRLGLRAAASICQLSAARRLLREAEWRAVLSGSDQDNVDRFRTERS